MKLNHHDLFAKWWKAGAVLIVFMVLTFSTVGYLAVNFGKLTLIDLFLSLMPRESMKGNNILVTGIDSTEGVQRSDTIIVVHVDEITNRVGVLSIPRDTRVAIKRYGLSKVNHSYAYGGVKLLMDSVSELLQIPLQFYVKLDLDGLARIVDKIGGVEINIKKRIYYADYSAGLKINFQPGYQQLSGSQIVEYIRFRNDSEGDIGRILRSQELLQVIAKKMIRSGKVFSTPGFLRELVQNVETNMSSRQIMGLAVHMSKSFGTGRVYSSTLPGAAVLIDGISYWRPNLVATKRMTDDVLLGFESGQEEDIIGAELFQPARHGPQFAEAVYSDLEAVPERPSSERTFISHDGIRLEILNGCGVNGLAARVGQHFRGRGFRVPWVGNAGNFNYPNTLLMSWNHPKENMDSIAQILNIHSHHVIVSTEQKEKVDATLVLGKDFDAAAYHVASIWVSHDAQVN